MDIGLDPIQESRKAPSILTYLLGETEEFDFVLVDWLAEHNMINHPDLPDECTDVKHLPIAHILDEFSRKYNSTVLKYFIARGAVTNAAGLTEDRLFISACKLCDLSDLQLVVAAGANIHEEEKYYRKNGLYVAVNNNRDIEIIKYLVDLGVDVNCVNDAFRNSKGTFKECTKTSVLDVAEQRGDLQIIDYLKSKGAKRACDLE